VCVCVCVCVFLGAVAGGRGMQIAKLSARPHFVLNNLCGNVCHTHEYALKRYVAVYEFNIKVSFN